MCSRPSSTRAWSSLHAGGRGRLPAWQQPLPDEARDSLFFDADAPHGPEQLTRLPMRYLSRSSAIRKRGVRCTDIQVMPACLNFNTPQSAKPGDVGLPSSSFDSHSTSVGRIARQTLVGCKFLGQVADDAMQAPSHFGCVTSSSILISSSGSGRRCHSSAAAARNSAARRADAPCRQRSPVSPSSGPDPICDSFPGSYRGED